MRSLRCWPIVIALTIGALALPAAARQRSRDIEVEQWVTAVQRHEPGALDEHVRVTAAWPRKKLNRVLDQLREEGTDALLFRSATLLADIAIHIPVTQRPQLANPDYAVIAQDGQPRGTMVLDSHLAAGRRLLDDVGSDPSAGDHQAQRAHAVAWYRAVSAMLAGQHNLADLQPHVRRSLERFPDSAGILFDAGCFAETYASPSMQAAIPPRADTPSRTKPVDLLRSLSRSSGALLVEAEQQFRAAVAREPAFTEARVRLGRVMTLRGRPAEAALELQRATALTSDGMVKYFAYLFLGDALQRSGNGTGALAAFRSAAAVFPSAQSPQLAISRVAAEQGDSTTARNAIDRVLQPVKDEGDRFDPWWVYYRASGRDAKHIYAAFATRIKHLAVGTGDLWRTTP